MRIAAVTLIALALTAGVADAQGRGRRANSQGIPPGHLPPPGECRVWYDGVPPGRQPGPTNCDAAERRAARDANARVIYGDNRYRNDDRYRSDDRYRYEDDVYRRDRSGTGSPIGDRIRDAMRSRYPNNVAQNSVPFRNGYEDGVRKGREDAGDRDSYDPVRHSWYRSGERGYESRYGTRDSYKLFYRDGFEAGYEDGYRAVRGYGRR